MKNKRLLGGELFVLMRAKYVESGKEKSPKDSFKWMTFLSRIGSRAQNGVGSRIDRLASVRLLLLLRSDSLFRHRIHPQLSVRAHSGRSSFQIPFFLFVLS